MEKIIIVGPGAMGCLFAGFFSAAGKEVWLYDKNPDRAERLNRQGVTVVDEQGERRFPVRAAVRPEEAGTADLIIICVKAYDTEAAAKAAKPLARKETLVLSLQNGVGNIEALEKVFPSRQILGGTTAQGANLLEPGKVRHAGGGETVLGQPDGAVDKAEKVAEFFRECGIPASATRDLQGLIFSKLVINAAINPLTALLGVRNGALLESPAALEIMKAVCDEVSELCRAMGVNLLFEDPFAKAKAVAEATAKNISSMLADVRAGRRTEIDHISAAVARLAEKHKTPAGVNRTLAQLVKAMEQTANLRLNRT